MCLRLREQRGRRSSGKSVTCSDRIHRVRAQRKAQFTIETQRRRKEGKNSGRRIGTLHAGIMTRGSSARHSTVNARRNPSLSLFVCVVMTFARLRAEPDPNTLVMIIESSPINLDPQVGVDAQSQRIDELLFDSLVTRDAQFNLQPSLAERWETPDPLTYIFHLRNGVRFHNGQPLTSRDVKWTFDSLINGKIRSAKAGTFALVSHINTAQRPNHHHMKRHHQWMMVVVFFFFAWLSYVSVLGFTPASTTHP